MKKTIITLALLTCALATLRAGDPVPVTPPGYGFIHSGGSGYSVWDSGGALRTGATYGDDHYSVTIPSSVGETATIRWGKQIIPLD